MINLIKKNRKKYYQEIIDKLDLYIYRDKRYHINFAIAIGFCESDVDMSNLIQSKRKTDEYIVLEKNLYCVIFDYSNDDSGIKATSNLQHEFEKKYFGKKLFIGVVNSKDYSNEENMVKSLFDILEYSIKNNMDNIVVDNSQMLTQNH